MRLIFKNLSYSFVSNLVSMILSALIISIVPKLVGINDFGYYQLYIFYIGYIGFFHFGWCDGIYLKYGGIEYEDYDKPLMSSQFWLITLCEIIVVLFLFTVIYFSNIEFNKSLIFYFACISIVLVIPRTLLVYLLQISNRIKEYSIVVTSEKVFYSLFTILFLVFHLNNFIILIFADLIGKVLSLLIGIYYCKDIVFSKFKFQKRIFIEMWDDISIGSKLLIANLASMMILGIVRIAIERVWDIGTYGKISLAINLSNMMMIFINAVGIVIFPILKRLDIIKIKGIYIKVKEYLMIFLFGVLLVYGPLKVILNLWLPSYSDSLEYLSVLFPICIYESQMALLINTYLKVLRQEKNLLKINCITVLFSCIFTYIVVFRYKNIVLTMLSIVVLFAFRCILAEYLLSKEIKISIFKSSFIEILMCMLFITFNYCFNVIFAFILYLIVYICYLIYKRKWILSLFNTIKKKIQGYKSVKI